MTHLPNSAGSVVVAILTYRRPTDLTELLPLVLDQAEACDRAVDVLVVDNDPDAGAKELVEGFPGLRYEHEPQPGIAAARNRALRETGRAELIVFIDDDERPCAGWLDSLLGIYDASQPSAVVGPVVSSFAQEPSRWITQGCVFDRRQLPTGTEIDVAATNNLLLDLEQIRNLGLEFDERFGITGGSDTLFTVQLRDRGGRMVWCQEAVVTDVVPAERATRGWVLRRAYRSGNGWSRVQLAMAGSGVGRFRTRCVLAVQGAVRVLGGGIRWLIGVVTGSLGRRARAMRTIVRGAGMLTGLSGLVYAEYRRPTLVTAAS